MGLASLSDKSKAEAEEFDAQKGLAKASPLQMQLNHPAGLKPNGMSTTIGGVGILQSILCCGLRRRLYSCHGEIITPKEFVLGQENL